MSDDAEWCRPPPDGLLLSYNVSGALGASACGAVLTRTGNAKIDGLQEDLHLTNGQYNASLTIFFVSYALFEPLTNVLLKKLRPSVFLPIIMLWWGICMTTMGLVHNFSGLMAAVSLLDSKIVSIF